MAGYVAQTMEAFRDALQWKPVLMYGGNASRADQRATGDGCFAQSAGCHRPFLCAVSRPRAAPEVCLSEVHTLSVLEALLGDIRHSLDTVAFGARKCLI